MKKPNRIMFAGPSGIGKTTLAKYVESLSSVDDPNWTFVSGSISDLLNIQLTHKDILSHDKTELYLQDFQILNIRKKLYSNHSTFVSDRSFLDSAAYFTYKQSATLPQCEIDHFLELCKMSLCQYCDMLIVLNFTPYMVGNWVIEDNNKRILNKYFQAQISSIMNTILSVWEVDPVNKFWEAFKRILNGCSVPFIDKDSYKKYKLNSIYGSCDILVINDPELDIRKAIINYELGVPCQRKE